MPEAQLAACICKRPQTIQLLVAWGRTRAGHLTAKAQGPHCDPRIEIVLFSLGPEIKLALHKELATVQQQTSMLVCDEKKTGMDTLTPNVFIQITTPVYYLGILHTDQQLRQLLATNNVTQQVM